jgi:hypothetical protein
MMTKADKRLLVGTAFVAVGVWIGVTMHYGNKKEDLQKDHTLRSLRTRGVVELRLPSKTQICR